MERVLGIGGYFFRAKDPQALARWYEANLGICVYPATDEWWMQQGGPTVLAPFEEDTGYFGRPDRTSPKPTATATDTTTTTKMMTNPSR